MSYQYVIHCHTGFAGMDSHEFVEFENKPSEDELNDIAWQFAVENAESYGIYPRERNDSELDEDSEDEYSDSIEGWAEEYAAEKHDGYKVGNTIYWNKL